LRNAEHLQTQRSVDVIVPAGTAQETVLKGYDVQAKRPGWLEGVVPAASAPFAARPTR
jgi:hypothetical protein